MKLMPYLIDGHNLIPKVPGLHLGSVDDEMQLVELLQEFCRLSRKQVEVYFDQAAPGQSGKRALGMVSAYFVRAGRTADQAISQRLYRIGRSARNWIVVSSDQSVQLAARQAGAQVLTSEAFANLLGKTLTQAGSTKTDKSEGSLSAEEVEEWLALFQSRRRNAP
jgi:hypothetical protein